MNATQCHKSVIFCCFEPMLKRDCSIYIEELYHKIVHNKAVISTKTHFLIHYASQDIELGSLSQTWGHFRPN